MAANTSTLYGAKSERLKSVQEFNIRTLKTLNYYGGYTTTEALSLIHRYTKAGVRKRMNSMVKQGWVQKVDQDEGLGRSEQLWCITKSGRHAAQTENDLPLKVSEVKGFSVSEYSPALCSHTKAVQVLASRLTCAYGSEEIRPFKMRLSDLEDSNYIVADIIFDEGIQERKHHSVSIYGLYEVELTVKPLGYYQNFLNGVDLHNRRLIERSDSYSIGQINFITPRVLFDQLERVLDKTKSNIPVTLFKENEILDGHKDKPIGKALHLAYTKTESAEEL